VSGFLGMHRITQKTKNQKKILYNCFSVSGREGLKPPEVGLLKDRKGGGNPCYLSAGGRRGLISLSARPSLCLGV